MAPETLKTSSATALTEEVPLLLRRMQPRAVATDTVMNMTIVTTQGNQPEMNDQQDDPTAPRND